MPSGVISHQAPGLILKIKYPSKFDGTALCISTLVPDLNVLVDPFLLFSFRNFTHSLLGLLIYSIPLTIILTIIFCRNICPFIANIAKRDNLIYKPLKYFGVDEWDNLKKKKYNSRYFIVAFYSALIGGLTHLILDLPAHEYVELFFPIIFQNPDFLLYSIVDFGPVTIGSIQIERDLTIYQLIWTIETLFTLIISLYLLRYIKKRNLINKWYE
ncbi:MAG: DUF4184 family protein [Candidatus Hodarchaeota archaeon]